MAWRASGAATGRPFERVEPQLNPIDRGDWLVPPEFTAMVAVGRPELQSRIGACRDEPLLRKGLCTSGADLPVVILSTR